MGQYASRVLFQEGEVLEEETFQENYFFTEIYIKQKDYLNQYIKEVLNYYKDFEQEKDSLKSGTIQKDFFIDDVYRKLKSFLCVKVQDRLYQLNSSLGNQQDLLGNDQGSDQTLNQDKQIKELIKFFYGQKEAYIPDYHQYEQHNCNIFTKTLKVIKDFSKIRDIGQNDSSFKQFLLFQSKPDQVIRFWILICILCGYIFLKKMFPNSDPQEGNMKLIVCFIISQEILFLLLDVLSRCSNTNVNFETSYQDKIQQLERMEISDEDLQIEFMRKPLELEIVLQIKFHYLSKNQKQFKRQVKLLEKRLNKNDSQNLDIQIKKNSLQYQNFSIYQNIKTQKNNTATTKEKQIGEKNEIFEEDVKETQQNKFHEENGQDKINEENEQNKSKQENEQNKCNQENQSIYLSQNDEKKDQNRFFFDGMSIFYSYIFQPQESGLSQKTIGVDLDYLELYEKRLKQDNRLVFDDIGQKGYKFSFYSCIVFILLFQTVLDFEGVPIQILKSFRNSLKRLTSIIIYDRSNTNRQKHNPDMRCYQVYFKISQKTNQPQSNQKIEQKNQFMNSLSQNDLLQSSNLIQEDENQSIYQELIDQQNLESQQLKFKNDLLRNSQDLVILNHQQNKQKNQQLISKEEMQQHKEYLEKLILQYDIIINDLQNHESESQLYFLGILPINDKQKQVVVISLAPFIVTFIIKIFKKWDFYYIFNYFEEIWKQSKLQ
ncbi:transmembrane protein, putative (macronuclear) [Tetrahymena thermophila SB210]|uniref:Transmembrane protein, putative n=1 Tax=Tetrahymena thermophila (strain SB210) TaxID=312017 RepID=Q22HH3_TETTS|nr:transmembrane protein, putative [Tetrahymena thermophila SB210]EAR84728.2 transmembrane protein, putative [Tetrahymena thermophila SB210]|eukprot:XP_001032391.2 transmembrane protein, putative [Tetrahymena thermophila SB210]